MIADKDLWWVVDVDEGVLSGPHKTKREAMDEAGVERTTRPYVSWPLYLAVQEPSDNPHVLRPIVGRRWALEREGFGDAISAHEEQ